MARKIGIGYQDFEAIRQNKYFYVDKTQFIEEWWEAGDHVTLITRPRRFGKTLNMSMLEKFFSIRYKGRDDLFQGLQIWEQEKFRKLQGNYPVISLSFANIKENDYQTVRRKLCQTLSNLYFEYDFLLDSDILGDRGKRFFESVTPDMDNTIATMAIHQLSLYLSRYYNKKVIILLDEYDTPMQEAYVNGYWDELAAFTRSMFNSTFKTNPYLERAIMTGITRVSTPKASLGKESIFSDLNNLEVVTTTSEKYETSFGFTEEEVWAAMKEQGLYEDRQSVKDWYDGFIFGKKEDIYNPWSIINYLDKKRLSPYWANTSSNSLTDTLIRQGNAEIKIDMEQLLNGGSIKKELDEQIVFNQLTEDENAIWSLLLASGYLKVKNHTLNGETGEEIYELVLTNKEVSIMFRKMIKRWFSGSQTVYNGFIKALLDSDINAMNTYMNRVALATFSYFDTGKTPSEEEPERFYHGFVLGLMVELSDRYILTSNRESGFGRYDVMLEPKNISDNGIILEFKVRDPNTEKELADTVKSALAQIDRLKYETMLVEKGVPSEKIHKYGFAFCGKTVLIDGI